MNIQCVIRYWARAFCLAALLVSAGASAAEGAKVVVLDLQRAIMMTDVAREKMKALENQKEYAESQKKAEALRSELMRKQEALQKEGPTWSAEKRNNQLKDMEFMRKDFELAAQKLQAEQQELMRELMKSLEPKVKQVLEQLIKDQQINMVLEKNAAIYADRSADITELMVEKLNKAP